jgi:ketosteroid isomerase-like protein
MTQITPAFLDAFGDAWNRHDTDAILADMTEDCVFQNSGGRGPRGRSYEGKADVRKGIDKIFATLQNVRWNNPTHFIAGNRGVTEWVMTADSPDGGIEVQGCDVFTFRDGKIAVKNSYLKQRTD